MMQFQNSYDGLALVAIELVASQSEVNQKPQLLTELQTIV